MKKHLLLSILLFIYSFSSFAQINIPDSTVQTIGYWDKNEKQNYLFSFESIRTKGEDTISKEMMRYKVAITILDSTATSYTIKWVYSGYENDSKNALSKDLGAIAQSKTIIFKTSELGEFRELLNWKDLQKDYSQKVKILRKKYAKELASEELIKRFEVSFASQGAVENAALNDVQQFYTYHGAKYKLNEDLEGQMKVPNMVGSEPFDADLYVSLDEIDEEENNYILRSTQIINPTQLTQATFEYLVKLYSSVGKPIPKRHELKEVTNETLISSRIHGSGWPLYSVQTKTTNSDGHGAIEERILELE